MLEKNTADPDALLALRVLMEKYRESQQGDALCVCGFRESL